MVTGLQPRPLLCSPKSTFDAMNSNPKRLQVAAASCLLCSFFSYFFVDFIYYIAKSIPKEELRKTKKKPNNDEDLMTL